MDAGKADFFSRLRVTQWSRIPLKLQESIAHPQSYYARVSLYKILFASVGISVPTFSRISGVSRYLQSAAEVSSFVLFCFKGTLLSKFS